jgi:hypothetical protein
MKASDSVNDRLDRCPRCGDLVPADEILATRHGTCRSCNGIRFWSNLVWTGVALLLLMQVALLAEAADEPVSFDAYEAYVKETGIRDYNIVAVALVRTFASETQTGLSEIVFNAGGEMVEYRVILAPWSFYRDWKQTVRHELCHLKVATRIGYIPAPTHNSAWRRCARRNNVDLSLYVQGEGDE